MNLREFCQLRDFPEALLTTYSFDPLFFERVVLPDLRDGGATRVTVLVDAEAGLPAIDNARGQLFHLGRNYRVVPVSMSGAFHPKLCLRLSTRGGLIACGSANLTRSGWLGLGPDGKGGNREIVGVFRLDPTDDSASAVRAVRDQLLHLPVMKHERRIIEESLSPAWVDAAAQVDPRKQGWLLTGVDMPLAEVLRLRWAGRKFARLEILTGSTDAHAEMIRWAHETFGIQDATVHVDLDRCGFAPSKLADLPVPLRIVPRCEGPRNHIKLAAFYTNSGAAAAVYGSANCSESAWVRGRSQGGNVEAVVVLDECDPAVLGKFFVSDVPAQPWQQLPLNEPQRDPKSTGQPPPPRQLLRMQLDRGDGRLHVFFDKPPALAEQPKAVVGQSVIGLRPGSTTDHWVGAQPDIEPGVLHSLFGHVVMGQGVAGTKTNSVWLEDLDELVRAAERRTPVDRLPRFGRPGTHEDYQQLLGDLRSLCGALANRPEDFADSVRKKPNDSVDADQPAPPIDPRSLLRSMVVDSRAKHPAGPSDGIQSISLTGFIRLILAEAEVPTLRHEIDLGAVESAKSSEEQDQEQEAGVVDSTPPPKSVAPTSAQAARLLRELTEFVDKTASPGFAQRCTARQLQQAAAFPIAVARFVRRGPWAKVVVQGTLDVLVERVCELLLRRRESLVDAKTGRKEVLEPLLESVSQRYRSDGRGDVFDGIVADGTLWLVLSSEVALLARRRGAMFERNLLLRDLVTSGLLISPLAVPDRLRELASRLNTDDQGHPLIAMVHRAVEAVDRLEDWLRLYTAQGKFPIPKSPIAGDWLWNSAAGFARIEFVHTQKIGRVHIRDRARTTDRVMLSYYVSLREIAEIDATLRQLWATCKSAPDADSCTSPVPSILPLPTTP